MHRRGFLSGVSVLAFGLRAAKAATSWTSYANPRFGTHCDVPPGFVVQPPPENGDGATFIAPDGAELRIFGQYNSDRLSPAAYAKQIIGFGAIANVTLNRSSANFAVLSGTTGDKIIYEKYVFQRDVVHTMSLTYPGASRATYDSIVTRLANSLRGG